MEHDVKHTSILILGSEDWPSEVWADWEISTPWLWTCALYLQKDVTLSDNIIENKQLGYLVIIINKVNENNGLQMWMAPLYLLL